MSEPKTNDELVAKIQEDIAARTPEIQQLINEVRSGVVQFQNQTIQQIHDKYKVELTGDENWGQLRHKNADVARHMSEVRGYLSRLEAERQTLLERIKEIEEQVHQEVITTNLSRPPKFRLSDDIREHLAKKPLTTEGVGRILAEYAVEIGFWKSVMRGLEDISERIKDNQISITSEAKAFQNGGGQ